MESDESGIASFVEITGATHAVRQNPLNSGVNLVQEGSS